MNVWTDNGRTLEASHPISSPGVFGSGELKQEVFLKKIIVEGYTAVGSLNDSFQSSNFLLLLLLLLFLIDFGQW